MVNVEISLTSWHENIKHNTEQIGACCMSAVAPHNEWSAVDMKLHRDKPFRLLGCVLWYVISGSHILTVFLCVCGGLEIRLSCSQICPASRCWGKGESRSTLSSTRFKNTAKKSDRHWRPRHSTTQPSLDRRYCLCVCVCEDGSERQVGGDWVTVMIWYVCVFVCLCVSFNQKCHVLLSVCSRLIYQSLPPLPSVSDWGEELAIVQCSSWLGENQQVATHTYTTTHTVTNSFSKLWLQHWLSF